MKLLWNNYATSSATYVGTTENVNYPIANLYEEQLSKVYRSVFVSTTEEIILQQSCAPTHVSIFNHNVSSSATIYVEAASSSGFTGAFSTTMDWAEYYMVTDEFVSTSKEFWRVRIEGNSTALSYAQSGYLFVGDSLDMPYMKRDQEITKKVVSNVVISHGGQVYGDEMYSYRNPVVNFPLVTSTWREQVQDVFDDRKNYGSMILMIWPDSLETESPMYCVFDQKELKWKRTTDRNHKWETTIKFREVF